MNNAPSFPGAAHVGDNRELLVFQIEGQEFCVDIMSVREIRGWTPTTALPHAPPYVRGTVNLRGRVLPIIDLASRLGFACGQTSARSVIVVTEVGPQVIGLLVDAVSGIVTISPDMIQPTPEIGSSLTRSMVQGIVTIDERMISALSLEHAIPVIDVEAEAA